MTGSFLASTPQTSTASNQLRQEKCPRCRWDRQQISPGWEPLLLRQNSSLNLTPPPWGTSAVHTWLTPLPYIHSAAASGPSKFCMIGKRSNLWMRRTGWRSQPPESKRITGNLKPFCYWDLGMVLHWQRFLTTRKIVVGCVNLLGTAWVEGVLTIISDWLRAQSDPWLNILQEILNSNFSSLVFKSLAWTTASLFLANYQKEGFCISRRSTLECVKHYPV